jgi:hypothetical protein
MIEFTEFPKISRYSREVIVTEKIDGTNAQIYITEDMQFLTGSKTRWVTPEDDNHGFSRWAHGNKEELLKLGIGRHYGEWWGSGIQRNYGLKEKRFSLFNVSRWENERPSCCHIIPVLWKGNFDEFDAQFWINFLKTNGSKAVPGFMQPEGIVIFHTAGNFGLKKTIEKDETPKSIR